MRLQKRPHILRPAWPRLVRSTGGNVAILFAVMMPVVVGGAGLGAETAYWRYTQLKLQAAADAAAFAGAVEKRGGSADGVVAAVATAAAQENGFAPGAIVVKASLASGASADNVVEVELSRTVSRFFTAYFSNAPVTIGAHAGASYTTSSTACVLALDPSAADAATVQGNGSLTLQGCSVMANSLSSQAVSVQGSAHLTTPCIITSGGVSLTSGAVMTSCTSAITQAPRAADPYADLAAPMAASCPGGGKSSSGSTLQPGTYCGGLDLKTAKTLNPGVYVIDGDLSFGANAVVSGEGVTFYLKGSGRLTMNGGARVDISAPTDTDDPYAGVLFYGDRTSAGGSNKINGDASSTLTGAFYFPSQGVEYVGNFTGDGGCVQVVAKTVKWSGSSVVSADCSSKGFKSVSALTAVKLTS